MAAAAAAWKAGRDSFTAVTLARFPLPLVELAFVFVVLSLALPCPEAHAGVCEQCASPTACNSMCSPTMQGRCINE